MTKCLNLEYDVVLSFAGEDRKFVEKTADSLRQAGVKVFYDLYEDTKLWGKDLYQHLDNIYQNKAKYAVIFISEAYGKKLWTNHELKSAQARAFTANEEYILPARFDDTEIPGIRKTIGYVDLRVLNPNDLAIKIAKKLGDIEPSNFIPKKVKYVIGAAKALYEGLTDDEIEAHVVHVFLLLQKTTEKERSLITFLILNACRHDITEDIHEDITLFERVSGLSKEEILLTLKALYNLGFEFKLRAKKVGKENTYEELSVKLLSRRLDLALENLTSILVLMYLGATKGMCSQCCQRTLNRLDFSSLKNKILQEDIEKILPS